MSPYETLYGRPCHSPIGWFKDGETKVLVPYLVQKAMDKVQLIRNRLLIAQSRQKSYTDMKRRYLVFTVEDKVFLWASPMKGVIWFGKKSKLRSRHIGPYKILDLIEGVAYHLALSPKMFFIHLMFYAFILKKYISNSSRILEAPTLQINENLTYEDETMAIIDR